jgi:hypothetical protein
MVEKELGIILPDSSYKCYMYNISTSETSVQWADFFYPKWYKELFFLIIGIMIQPVEHTLY